jgi:hypothetical protein
MPMDEFPVSADAAKDVSQKDPHFIRRITIGRPYPADLELRPEGKITASGTGERAADRRMRSRRAQLGCPVRNRCANWGEALREVVTRDAQGPEFPPRLFVHKRRVQFGRRKFRGCDVLATGWDRTMQPSPGPVETDQALDGEVQRILGVSIFAQRLDVKEAHQPGIPCRLA